VPKTADDAILKLNNLEMWIKLTLENLKDLRNEKESDNKMLNFVDVAFSNEIDRIIHQAE